MQEVYSEIHNWLGRLDDSADFRFSSAGLDYEDIREVGNHFHKFFPAHYFKVASTLKEIVTYDSIVTWLQDDGRICVVDFGCGSGAGSCAFIECLRHIITDFDFTAPIHVHFIGLDPVEAALAVYRATLDRTKKHSDLPINLKITHEFLCEKLPEGANSLARLLRNRRKNWDQPYLSHTLLLQVNTIRPYCNQGVLQDVAESHYRLFSAAPMDQVHILTIGTKNLKSQVERFDQYNQWAFAEHAMLTQQLFWKDCSYANPQHSFYKDRNIDWWSTKYHSCRTSVTNSEWQMDALWQSIIAVSNLELAWARARNALLREPLVDEAEIKLRDRDVNRFLHRLRSRLIAYANDTFHPTDHVFYEFPKSSTAFRPMSLSRFEEEILSVAILQIIGPEFERNRELFAHQLNDVKVAKSEFLYKYWGESYKGYLDSVRQIAAGADNKFILKTDLKSFYTNIKQTLLRDKTIAEGKIVGERAIWLLEKVLYKFLDPSYHLMGFGLAQGGVGSGFYANVYLEDLDTYFDSEHARHVRYFRYADDMIIVASDKSSAAHMKTSLEKLLGHINLTLNREKTKCFSTSQIDKEIPAALSAELDQSSYRFNKTLKFLWELACFYYYDLSVGEESLYDFLMDLEARFRELSILASIPMLRRKLRKYLTREPASFGDRPPEFGGKGQHKRWAADFRQRYPNWLTDLERLKHEYMRLVTRILDSSSEDFANVSDEDSKRLRFGISRLCRLGIDEDMAQHISEILIRRPGLLRHQSFVLQSIAEYGHANVVLELYERLSSVHTDQTYMRAMLVRAMRYLNDLPRSVYDVAFDTDESDVVRLMASETILASGVRELSASDWVSVNNILSNEPLMPRLRKNLILLLRQVRDRDPQTFKPGPSEDEILHEAWKVQNGTNIFEQPEPSILQDYFDPNIPDDAYEFGELMTTISF